MAVRSLLMYRKNFATLLAESVRTPSPSCTSRVCSPALWMCWQQLRDKPAGEPSYLTAAAPPSQRPPMPLCSVCGYKGKYTCLRCGLRYCDIGCRQTHDESRCERR
jgi:zinc finger HIT domain-containing protein 1